MYIYSNTTQIYIHIHISNLFHNNVLRYATYFSNIKLKRAWTIDVFEELNVLNTSRIGEGEGKTVFFFY